ncbi:MAG: epimerase [Bacteroidetes bacterium]|nr:MAG: epimerase [Bacteroidota bacterium]
MNVIIFGASGMIGRGTLLECLDDPGIERVLTIGRSPVPDQHPKLRQISHSDFTDFSGIADQLQGYDACFFCLGVSAAGMREADYRRVTYDFTLAAARTLLPLNPDMTFVYVSGEGTDSSEQGRLMWARVKGKTENDLLALGFRQAVMFRPGMILPLRGIRSKTPSYQFFYSYFSWLLRAIMAVFPNAATDTTRLGRAMITVARDGSPQVILRNPDINALGQSGE